MAAASEYSHREPLSDSSNRSARRSEAQDLANATYSTAASPPPPKLKSAIKQTTKSAGAVGSGAGTGAGTGGVKKTAPMTAAARRKRELEVASYIEMLPLEYRSQEPVSLFVGLRKAKTNIQAMRIGMEKVIKKLLDNPDGNTCTSHHFTCTDSKVQQMISAPDLPQAKVNKHLMALVARKLVVKVPGPVSSIQVQS